MGNDWFSWNPFAKKGANICSGLDHCCPTVKGDRSKGAKGTCVSMSTSCSSVGTADPAAVQAKAASCNAGDWFSWSPVKAGDGICVGAQHCCPNKKGDRSAGAAGSCVSWSTSCSEVGTTATTSAATSDDKLASEQKAKAEMQDPAAQAQAAEVAGEVKQFVDAHEADTEAFLKAHEAQLQAAVAEHKGDVVAALKKVAAMVQDGSIGAKAAASASA